MAVVSLGAALLASTAALGWFRLFWGFASYDDEGYFLVSIKGYLAGARLYDQVYGPYGPFYWEFMAGAFKTFGLSVTNDAGRVFTLIFWLAAAALFALFVYRLTRSALLAGIVDAIAFYVLSTGHWEPGAPHHLLAVVLAGSLVAATFVERRPRAALVVIGALSAAELLMKINVGLFAFLALALATLFAWGAAGRPGVDVAIVALVSAPLVLMWQTIGQRHFALFAAHLSVCGLALGIVCSATGLAGPLRSNGARRWFAWAAAGAAALAAVTIGVALAQGTTVHALLYSVVVEPLGKANRFRSPVLLSTGTIAWDVVGLAGAIAVGPFEAFRRLDGRVVALLRLVAGALIWHGMFAGGSDMLEAAPALAWVAAVPRPGEAATPARRFIRFFPPVLAITAALRAYPVAGAQLLSAAVAFVPVGAVCVADGLALLARDTRLSRLRTPALSAGAVAVAAAAVLAPLISARKTYDSGVPIRTIGTSRIHVLPLTSSIYSGLAASIRRNCSTFVSSPGLNSFYLMTGETPPTWTNLSNWLYTFGPGTQARIVQDISHVRGLCTVRSPYIESIWSQGRPIPPLPLYEFVLRGTSDGTWYGKFEIGLPSNAKAR